MKELITKQEVTKEVYKAICNSCGKRIEGATKSVVVLNLARHKSGNLCKKATFEKRVQDALPPKDPNYVSSKSNKTQGDTDGS